MRVHTWMSSFYRFALWLKSAGKSSVAHIQHRKKFPESQTLVAVTLHQVHWYHTANRIDFGLLWNLTCSLCSYQTAPENGNFVLWVDEFSWSSNSNNNKKSHGINYVQSWEFLVISVLFAGSFKWNARNITIDSKLKNDFLLLFVRFFHLSCAFS